MGCWRNKYALTNNPTDPSPLYSVSCLVHLRLTGFLYILQYHIFADSKKRRDRELAVEMRPKSGARLTELNLLRASAFPTLRYDLRLRITVVTLGGAQGTPAPALALG